MKKQVCFSKLRIVIIFSLAAVLIWSVMWPKLTLKGISSSNSRGGMVISLTGSNYEIGFQRAKLYLDDLKQWENQSKEFFRGSNGLALKLAFQYHLTEIRERFPSLINEWQGMADGAQIPFEDVALHETGERRIYHLAGLQFNGKTETEEEDLSEACSIIAITESEHGPIVVNTGDGSGKPSGNKIYVIEKENDPGQYRVVRCKGAGLNEKGLAIGSANAHYRGWDSNYQGKASELSKVVLRYCPDVDSAVKFIEKYRISDDGNHYAMADISGNAAAVEKGPEGIFNVRWAGSPGYAFATNVSPDSILRSKCTSREDYFLNADNRYSNLEDLFTDPNFTFTFTSAENIAFNHDSVGAICQHGDVYPGQWYTTRTRLMLPQEGRMLLAAKTSSEQETWKPCESGWIEDTLTLKTSIEDLREIDLPEECRLAQNYPNPFNAQTTIEYRLIENSRVEISVYNMLGEKVKTLIEDYQTTGEHSVIWDGRNDYDLAVASGLYYYQLKADDFVLTKKMNLIK
jgi:hypothetical protein